MTGYYAERLSGERLRRCYDAAPPRVRRYLEEEVRHLLRRIRPVDRVLELGCGYGRIARRLAGVAQDVVGIDTAAQSLDLARRLAVPGERCTYLAMDALALAFPDALFDVVVCAQNGICAFGVDPAALLRESLRVTRKGGRVVLSSYADRFWPERLAWFEIQASLGLLGPIDRVASRDGVIVCEDGFRAGRMDEDGFRALCATAGVRGEIEEVDGSSLFCEIVRAA